MSEPKIPIQIPLKVRVRGCASKIEAAPKPAEKAKAINGNEKVEGGGERRTGGG